MKEKKPLSFTSRRSLSFTYDDWVEIHCALTSKVNLVESGYYNPEEKPGDNKRWVKDITRIQRTMEKAGLS